MKKIPHPSEGRYGTGNKAFYYRCGPTAMHKGQMDGGKDLSKSATNSMGTISKTEMNSPGPKARQH